MTYEEAVRSLFALGRELAAPQQARVQKFGLDNIRILSVALGNAHLRIPCAHVAGTNGKGSTAAILESILRAAGFRTGLYTSPHLERINERIRINGEEISDELFTVAWTRVQSTIETLMASGKLSAHPTFFECVTAIAFVAFENLGDHPFVVYEVGLGGRLDSTNIIEPEVAVITPIDFDHENFLGHSIEEIASEKAGIIKPGAWVVSAPQRSEAGTVIARRTVEMRARLVETDMIWRLGEITSEDGHYSTLARMVKSPDNALASVTPTDELAIAPTLSGRFQIQNALSAATASVLLRERGFPISSDAITSGISSANWPGRLERISQRPAIYLDGAHNPAAARELKVFSQENFSDRRIILVYGAMRDKAVDEIAGLLFPMADSVILTQPSQPRAITAPLLGEMTAGLARHVTVVANPTEAFERAVANAAPDDVIFVTGSLFLVGDIRRYHRVHGLLNSPVASAEQSASR